MTRVFDVLVFVSYSQAYLQVAGAEMASMEDMFAGQANGLCGAAVAGSLFLTTGLHTGFVPFAVEVLDQAPPVNEDLPDVVEVSFTTDQPEVLLLGWGGDIAGAIALGAPGSYRVRYSAHAMDAGREQDTGVDNEASPDRYLLQFWPAPPAADAVVRQGSEIAAYWHEWARTLPPPPTAAERGAALRIAAELAEARGVAALADSERPWWGGQAPSDRLRLLGGNVLGVANTDRDLLNSFESLDPDSQRAAARWLARRAFELAKLDTQDWVRPALEAMDRGTRYRHHSPTHLRFMRCCGMARRLVTSWWGLPIRTTSGRAASTDPPSPYRRCSAPSRMIRCALWSTPSATHRRRSTMTGTRSSSN